MKNIASLITLFFITCSVFAQTDKDLLALNVSKAEEQNQAKLKEYIWKRSSNVFVDNQLKQTTVTEFKFDKTGKLESTVIDKTSTVKQQPGLRGVAQQNAAAEKSEYIQKALQLSLKYAFMSKGELVDFFNKAAITEKDGKIEAVASNVHVTGDKLLIRVDPATNLIIYREFTSLLGSDLIDGKLSYDKFSNGTMHGTTTTINMPVQKMRIDGLNKDYTIRVD